MVRKRCLLLAVGLVVSVGATSAAEAQVLTGTINLHLGVPPATQLGGTTIELTNPAIAYSAVIDLGGGLGPFTVTNLPTANGYTVSVTATTVAGATCGGVTANFPIVTNGTTIVVVNLACAPLPVARVPAVGQHAPLLALLLALLGVFAMRRRGHNDAGHGPPPMFGVHRRQS